MKIVCSVVDGGGGGFWKKLSVYDLQYAKTVQIY